ENFTEVQFMECGKSTSILVLSHAEQYTKANWNTLVVSTHKPCFHGIFYSKKSKNKDYHLRYSHPSGEYSCLPENDWEHDPPDVGTIWESTKEVLFIWNGKKVVL